MDNEQKKQNLEMTLLKLKSSYYDSMMQVELHQANLRELFKNINEVEKLLKEIYESEKSNA